ncbi:MAG: proline dehydrogenase family protein [Armatimonadota bacterium]|nr:proline dehydrogenase family protein [Armatimonadota bacterium]MDR7427185.1 proline dehydrogenase family protein [Armatimonadota bacterium]MDR7464993.1 proline dehydrogenase family protein [Armatimonadota bacterium]MDR7473532.1 proline dehydrogenase family protein [Armatimonadota bacterium]MDR7539989.1 proline dehydrogenase family protein [Armatimonadota bacterium]
MSALRAFFIYLSQHRGMQRFVLRNPVARRASRRFVAGETLAEGVAAVRALNGLGIHASLNYLGEKTTSPAEAQEAANHYLEVLEAITLERLDCNLSIKLSQLGLASDAVLAERLLRRILEAADREGIFVRIDMEESALVDPTLALWRRVWGEGWSNVGLVIQSYLRRSEQDLADLVETGVRIRLVKGAYLEPPAVAYPRKADVDAAYRRLTDVLLHRGTYPAIATHDPRMIAYARAVAAGEGIGPERFEFQMIYGVRRDLQAALVRQGYHVRVYVPFGEQWYPYFMRRLGERPANVLFLLRSVFAEWR